MSEPALATLIAEILKVDPAALTLQSDRTTIASWDSLSQVTIAMKLDATYGIDLTDEETDSLWSVAAVCAALDAHGVAWTFRSAN